MEQMKSTHVTCKMRDGYVTDETEGESLIFPFSQFFPARDGTWLMVDWMSHFDEWYVTEGTM
jgi:hypothetical protein